MICRFSQRSGSVLTRGFGCIGSAVKPASATRVIEPYAALSRRGSKPDFELPLGDPTSSAHSDARGALIQALTAASPSCDVEKHVNLQALIQAMQDTTSCSAQQKTMDTHMLVQEMQGYWSDDLGASIHIQGNVASKELYGLTGSWSLEHIDGELFLDGALMTGSLDELVWKYPSGVERKWTRISSMDSEEYIL